MGLVEQVLKLGAGCFDPFRIETFPSNFPGMSFVPHSIPGYCSCDGSAIEMTRLYFLDPDVAPPGLLMVDWAR